MEPTHVIKMPIVNEKVTAAGEHNQYAFRVDGRATKTDVKKAVEAIYGVKVVDVRSVTGPRGVRRGSGKGRDSARHCGTRCPWRCLTQTGRGGGSSAVQRITGNADSVGQTRSDRPFIGAGRPSSPWLRPLFVSTRPTCGMSRRHAVKGRL
jgi:large subunit ribosomal protein L23